MYSDLSVAEHERQVTTKIRLSSHNMAIEKGRWSRTPREQRLCECGQIQTERHIIGECPTTEAVRVQNPELNFDLPMFFNVNAKLMCSLCAKLTKKFV